MNTLATRAGFLRSAGKHSPQLTDYGYFVTIDEQDSYFLEIRGTLDRPAPYN